MTTNKKNIAILSFAMIVAMLGFGMVIPIFPFYVERMGASGDDLGFLIATAALTQLLFSPVWGGVSDRIGRRPVLIIGMAGSSLTLLMFGLSTQLWMLYVARALSGILSSATFPAAMAYISDSTAEQDRGGGIGIVSAAAWLGLIIGPGVGGWLAGDSISRPFFMRAFVEHPAHRHPLGASPPATGAYPLLTLAPRRLMTSLPPQGDALSPPPGGWKLVSLTHRTHLNTQLYKALQLNCEPYPPFPRTPGDLHRIARFWMNGSQMPGLGPLFLREQKTFAFMLLSRMMAFIVLYHCRFYESIQ